VWASGAVGSAREWHSRGQGFEPPLVHHFFFLVFLPETKALAWGRGLSTLRYLGGFNGGREVSKTASRDLPWGLEAITDYNIIEAEDLDSAEQIARDNPYIASIRVYEFRSM
jgi:hypothetical protein